MSDPHVRVIGHRTDASGAHQYVRPTVRPVVRAQWLSLENGRKRAVIACD